MFYSLKPRGMHSLRMQRACSRARPWPTHWAYTLRKPVRSAMQTPTSTACGVRPGGAARSLTRPHGSGGSLSLSLRTHSARRCGTSWGTRACTSPAAREAPASARALAALTIGETVMGLRMVMASRRRSAQRLAQWRRQRVRKSRARSSTRQGHDID